MLLIGGRYNFAEKWSEINPRFATADKEVSLNLGIFTALDKDRADVVNGDCTPVQIQGFMVKTSVALSYCAVMIARLGGHLNQMSQNFDLAKAQRSSTLVAEADPTKKPKSEAAIDRLLETDLNLIDLKWSVEDLKVMKAYGENIFRTLQKDAENWRARFYGGHQDRKLTPGVETPWIGGNDDGDIPAPIGG